MVDRPHRSDGLDSAGQFRVVIGGLVYDRPDSKSRRLLGVLTMVLALIPVSTFEASRHHAPTNSCAKQKTIASAIEMYNLDRNTKRTVLDAALWEAPGRRR
ncbi:MAG: hypothetical protein HY815_26640 [Candidatus Riflebacteria bacterium]|nr:hypothetical protein [Candidatus Riflebacteria bacterium]